MEGQALVTVLVTCQLTCLQDRNNFTEERMSSFEKHSFSFMDVCVCMCVCHMSVDTQRDQDMFVAVGCLTGVLGTEL